MSNPELLAELAPTGVSRAGINLGDFLLVTGRSASDEPEGGELQPRSISRNASIAAEDVRGGTGSDVTSAALSVATARRGTGLLPGGRA